MASLPDYLALGFNATQADRPGPLAICDAGLPNRKLFAWDAWGNSRRLRISAARTGAETYQSVSVQLDVEGVRRLRDHLTKMLGQAPAQAYPTSVASGGAGPTYVFSNPGTYIIREG